MSSKKLFSLLVLLFLIVGLVPATVAAQPDPANVENPPEPKADVVLSATGETGAEPAAPPQVLADVDLILDDGASENNIGIGGTWEFGWVNRFTPDPKPLFGAGKCYATGNQLHKKRRDSTERNTLHAGRLERCPCAADADLDISARICRPGSGRANGRTCFLLSSCQRAFTLGRGAGGLCRAGQSDGSHPL